MVRKILSVMCIWVVVQTVHAAQNQIDGLRIWPSPDNTRIVLDMSSAPEFTYFPLKNPHRLVIDLSNTSDSKTLSLQTDSGDLVRKVRYSTPKNKQSARVVIAKDRKSVV